MVFGIAWLIMKSQKTVEREVKEVIHVLQKQFTGKGAMDLATPYRTLVGVLLSARTRDEQVLKLLPAFFSAFPNTAILSNATVLEIESRINTIGMYKQKAKNLKAMALRVEKVFSGKIPQTMDELVSLAGVGRKTASVLLPLLFDTSAIAVDTHVHRVANRLGWVKTKTAPQTEKELLRILPGDLLREMNLVFVKFGRYICLAPTPRCYLCPFQEICEFKRKNLQEPANLQEIQANIIHREEILQQLRNAVLKTI